jgi:glycosyltransferase involved in cell wall biosynthesis
MAGIGIRYAEMTRTLAGAGFEVVLVTAGDVEDAKALGLPAHEVRALGARGRRQWWGSDAIVMQGRAATPLLVGARGRPVVVDLYDPWLIENMHYWESLRNQAYRRDLRSWNKQLAAGDLFLASCEQQRLHYLGMLIALGRIGPQALSADPELRDRVVEASFGVPAELPVHRPVLPEAPGTTRILFGCLYDWLDPWPLLEALAARPDEPWELIFVATPNPESTPRRQLDRVRDWSLKRGWWDTRVRLIEWVDADRRFDLFRDVDLLVVAHVASLESQLGLRTRVLDAAAAGCPVVVADGGATAALVRQHDLGRVVRPGDAEAMGQAIDGVVAEDSAARERAARSLRQARHWDHVLQPLTQFLAAIGADPARRGEGVAAR